MKHEYHKGPGAKVADRASGIDAVKRPLTPHEKRVDTAMRNAQDAHFALARAKRQAGLQTRWKQEAPNSANYSKASSASGVRACEVCGAMVVDSAVGWRAHWARMPFCAAGK